MNWMEDIDVESPGGKLKCPGCGEWVGEYSWLGLQCEDCGEVVAPGLALVRRGNVELMEFPGEGELGLGVSDDQDTPREEMDESVETTDTSTREITTQTPRVPTSQDTTTRTQTQQTEGSPRRSIRRIVRHPTNLTIPSITRHLPKMPSPLRNTWFPRSAAPSRETSPDNSQGSVLSNRATLQHESDRNEGTEEGGRTSVDDEWTTNVSGGFPRTSEEVLELVQEYLGGLNEV